MILTETKYAIKNILNAPNLGYQSISELNSIACAKVGIAFQNLRHVPQDPEVFYCYEKFKAETKLQFNFLRASGISVRPWLQEGQPYLNSKQLFDEFSQTKTLYVYLTAHGYGSDNTYLTDHPMLEPSGIYIDDVPLVYNDLFRAVHDAFGHIPGANSFSCLGELRAALNHLKFYSADAAQAMLSETVGQICWYYFGPHLCEIVVGDNEEVVKMSDRAKELRVYPQQKAGLLPRELVDRLFSNCDN
jgi:hypothetical protein